MVLGVLTSIEPVLKTLTSSSRSAGVRVGGAIVSDIIWLERRKVLSDDNIWRGKRGCIVIDEDGRSMEIEQE